MKRTPTSKMMLLALFIFVQQILNAQFNFMYQHGMSDDHTSIVSSISRLGYIQCGSSFVGGNWDVHLLKINAAGNPLLDVTMSTANNEHALHVVQGNNDTYIVCGYERVGVLDLGFVMRVDTNFNLINKVIINVPLANKHTPALNVINSAFYLQPGNNTYFPPDPNGGYLITGFEAMGYNPMDSKSGYAIKVDNNLNIQWARKFDSPIVPGLPDWDMCNSASYMWSGSLGYFVGGTGTSTPAFEQCALATLLDTTGSIIWKELYSDNNVPGTSCVSADCAYDDAVFEFYQLNNYSSLQCAGITAFDQTTGAIVGAKTRYINAGYSQDHYAYEFGSTCATSEILISGYGHNQTHGSVSGTFPYIIRYNKDFPAVNVWGAHYEMKVPSVNYSPSTTIFDIYQSATHPRIFYPKMYAQRNTNEINLAAFEDDLTFSENKIIQTDFQGKDSCGYFDPGFFPLQINTFLFPVNDVVATYVLSPATCTQNPLLNTPIPCQLCPANANFTYTNIGCTYTFTANFAGGLCPFWTIKDVSNNIIFTSLGNTMTYVFSLSGTYTICFSDCAIGSNGQVCRNEKCVTIVTNCTPPCGVLNADFSFTINGCCVTFSDNTPDGNNDGCESWTFGTFISVLAGDNYTFCFPYSGTFNVCHTDCCFDVGTGTNIYHQVCKTVTVNCTPPCCLPNGFLVSSGAGGACCRVFNATFPVGCTPSTSLAYWWDFGDGNVSSGASPTHCYNANGVYTVCLTVWCSKFNKIQFCQSILVKCILPPPPPCCIGTSKMNFGFSGQSVTASDGSDILPGSVVALYQWAWGDGTTSEGAQATHYYQVAGSYTITHTISGTNSGGQLVSDEVSQTITVHMAPPCTCPPHDPLVFADSPLQCTQSNHSTCLKVIDTDGESGIIYQWMQSPNSGGPYTEIPNAVGQQVWINGIGGPMYFVCRSMSVLTGAFTISEEIDIEDAHFIVTITPSATELCIGEMVTLTASPADGVYYEWEPHASSTNVVTYAVCCFGDPDNNCAFVRTSSGCGAEGFVSVTVNNCVVPANNNFASATNVSIAGVAYPIGNCYNGTLAYATVTPQGTAANVLPAGGQDVWYKITAPSTALRVVATTSSMNLVLELHNAAGVEIDMENDNAAIGNETMSTSGLTEGAVYYVAIRSYDGVLGPFTVCIQALIDSYCADGSGAYDLCANFKPAWSGASSYTYNFTPTGGTLGSPTSATHTSQISLSTAALALRHNGTYNVTIDANFNLPEGEMLTVVGTDICSVSITPHTSVEVKLTQRCPSILLKSTILQGKPYLCGATNFTVEFTELNGCAGTPLFLPIIGTTFGSASQIKLSNVPGLMGGGRWYQVRWRPNFAYGPGTYGTPRVIFIGGSVISIDNISPTTSETKTSVESNIAASIYPNPNNGEMFNLNLTGIESDFAFVRIMDSMGKLIYHNKYAVEGSLNTIIVFENRLASGLYMVELVVGENVITERIIVER